MGSGLGFREASFLSSIPEEAQSDSAFILSFHLVKVFQNYLCFIVKNNLGLYLTPKLIFSSVHLVIEQIFTECLLGTGATKLDKTHLVLR